MDKISSTISSSDSGDFLRAERAATTASSDVHHVLVNGMPLQVSTGKEAEVTHEITAESRKRAREGFSSEQSEELPVKKQALENRHIAAISDEGNTTPELNSLGTTAMSLSDYDVSSISPITVGSAETAISENQLPTRELTRKALEIVSRHSYEQVFVERTKIQQNIDAARSKMYHHLEAAFQKIKPTAANTQRLTEAQLILEQIENEPGALTEDNLVSLYSKLRGSLSADERAESKNYLRSMRSWSSALSAAENYLTDIRRCISRETTTLEASIDSLASASIFMTLDLEGKGNILRLRIKVAENASDLATARAFHAFNRAANFAEGVVICKAQVIVAQQEHNKVLEKQWSDLAKMHKKASIMYEKLALQPRSENIINRDTAANAYRMAISHRISSLNRELNKDLQDSHLMLANAYEAQNYCEEQILLCVEKQESQKEGFLKVLHGYCKRAVHSGEHALRMYESLEQGEQEIAPYWADAANRDQDIIDLVLDVRASDGAIIKTYSSSELYVLETLASAQYTIASCWQYAFIEDQNENGGLGDLWNEAADTAQMELMYREKMLQAVRKENQELAGAWKNPAEKAHEALQYRLQHIHFSGNGQEVEADAAENQAEFLENEAKNLAEKAQLIQERSSNEAVA